MGAEFAVVATGDETLVLARAGSGDILAGFLASLLLVTEPSDHDKILQVLSWGVFLHLCIGQSPTNSKEHLDLIALSLSKLRRIQERDLFDNAN